MNESIETRKRVDSFLLGNPKNEPITEQQNQVTTNIDMARTGENIMKLLHQTDKQIFDGWQINEQLRSQGLRDDRVILDKLNRLSELIRRRVLHCQSVGKKLKLILSGCGTSGRLAYLSSRTFADHLKNESAKDEYEQALRKHFECDYIIAGDEYALVNSVESVEDKPQIGLLKLKEKLTDATMPVEFILIGITCGLSAPFVAGQLDFCLNWPESEEYMVACGIMGFNPIEMSRQNVKVNEDGETFLDLMLKMKKNEEVQADKYFVLNPYIGPEPITGSSRMKSGTCTKIMLDLILTSTLRNSNNSFDYQALIGYYERLVDEVVYSPENQIELGQVINKSGETLARNESVNYLCDSVRLGLLCCVDASECVPTFGAKRNDFKGFVNASLKNGKDTSFDGFLTSCTTTWLTNIQLEMLNSDLFILVDDDDDDVGENGQKESHVSKRFMKSKLASETKCTFANLDVSFKSKPCKLGSILNQAAQEVNQYFAKCLQEFYTKLSINAISTGAHVLIGKTYSNIMIDVRVSNIKLYHRAINILSRLSNAQKERNACEQSLLRAIYETDHVQMEIERNLDKVIELATAKEFVVPKALIMLLTGCDLGTATKMIDETRQNTSTSIRDCIYKLINKQQ